MIFRKKKLKFLTRWNPDFLKCHRTIRVRINIGERLMKKIVVIIIAIVIVLMFLTWTVSVINCEILTLKHIEEFSLEDTEIVSEISFKRILSYTPWRAKIYCVSQNERLGSVLEFENKNGNWVYASWDTYWTKLGGNADRRVWPYFWR